MPQLAGRTIGAAILLGLFASHPSASPSTTVLTGVVSDEMQGLVAGAAVVLLDAQGVARWKGRTDKHGRYSTKATPDGNYRLEISLAGFAVATDVLALSGGTMQRDATLRIGQLSEKVTVRASDDSGPSLLGRESKAPDHTCKRPFVAGGPGGYVEAPTKVRIVYPRYPESMKGETAGGNVEIHAVVSTEGAVTGLRVLSATHPDFAKAAVEAVSAWRYDATRLNCTPVDTVMRVDVVFER